jgi:hypothetical protein
MGVVAEHQRFALAVMDKSQAATSSICRETKRTGW